MSNDIKDTIVIIPAAGLATRLRPISNAMSKAMVPVGGQPILSRILGTLSKISAVKQVIIVRGELRDIEDFVSTKSYPFELNVCQQINMEGQPDTKGPLQAIESAANLIDVTDSEMNVLVWLGDTLVTDVSEVERIMGARAWTVATSKVDDYSRWCMIKDTPTGAVLYDKPDTKPDTNQALIGLYQFGNCGAFIYHVIEAMKDDTPTHEIASLLDQSYISTCEFKSWLDAGDLQSLHAANAALINSKSRSHNYVSISGQTVTKQSSEAEGQWYKTMEEKFPRAKLIMPQVYSIDGNKVEIEVCSGSTLQDMLVYDRIREECWSFIINNVVTRYNQAFASYEVAPTLTAYDMFRWNILNRIADIPAHILPDKSDDTVLSEFLKSSFDFIERYCLNRIDVNRGIIHGDFHFGNIIYDATCDKVKAIDPRGKWGSITTTAGHFLYDMAKLYQGPYAGYSWIVSGEEINYAQRKIVVKAIDDAIACRFESALAKRYALILQISAIPLHSDDEARQRRMLNESMRLIYNPE